MYLPISGTGNGSAPVVNLTWPFIDKSHVQALVNGSPVVASWTGANQITFASVVPNGTPWSVSRVTPYDHAIVDFTDGSVLTEADLDLAFTQLRYVFEEARALGLGGDVALRTDLLAAGGADRVFTLVGDSVQDELDKIGTKDEGTLPAGPDSYNPFVTSKTAATGAAGTSDWRAAVDIATLTGTHGAAQFNGKNTQLNILHSSGTLNFAIGKQGYVAVGVPHTISITGNVSYAAWLQGHISHTGSGHLTFAATYDGRGIDLDVGAGTVDKFHNFHSDDISGGAGNTRITAETYGFFQGNSSLNGAPITAAFGSEMSDNGDSKRYTFYVTGGAPNFLAGQLKLGGTPGAPTERLELGVGNLKIASGVVKIGANQVLSARQAGTPAAATDLASAITLVNFLRTALQTHGAIA